jgi:hypothetical protein
MTAAMSATSLPPEALELIRQGAPKSLREKPVLVEMPITPAIAPAVPLPTNPEASAIQAKVAVEKRVRPAREPQPRQLDEIVLVQESYRLPQPLLRSLSRACFERKTKRLRPFTRQAVVALALEEWLKKEGVVDEPVNP